MKQLQPFQPFLDAYIPRLIELNKLFLVSQPYYRLATSANEIPILLTEYDDIGLAKTHFAVVKDEKYASVINLQNQLHLHKLNDILKQSSQYRVYWAVVLNEQAFAEHVKKNYSQHLRRYLLSHAPWKIAATAKLSTTLQVIFGELFVTIKYKQDQLRVKFSEIENA